MQDRERDAFKLFSGRLEGTERVLCLHFRARLSNGGEIEFEFDDILDPEARSTISRIYRENKTCNLIGTAEDGTSLHAAHFYINEFGSGFSQDTGNYIRLGGRSGLTTLCYELTVPAEKPLMRLCLKGFRHYPPSRASCRLGTIQIGGATALTEENIISGVVELAPDDNAPVNLLEWKVEAERLLEHVRMIMSFAGGAVLQAPITEFVEDRKLEQIVRSQARQASSPIPNFNWLVQQELVFAAAVRSFFDPPVPVKNLLLAIEWFVMDSTYNEVRLMSAMTALENLVASNLNVTDAFIQPVDEAQGENPEEKFRRETKLRIQDGIKRTIAAWPPESRGQLYKTLDELNRRPFLDKLRTLAERWSVPLAGLEPKIVAAKKARDHIVHRGEFDEQDFDRSWEHVTVAREVVVRFVLTAIGYRGPYISHLTGLHEAEFPP